MLSFSVNIITKMVNRMKASMVMHTMKTSLGICSALNELGTKFRHSSTRQVVISSNTPKMQP